jgi:hypothetical protein
VPGVALPAQKAASVDGSSLYVSGSTSFAVGSAGHFTVRTSPAVRLSESGALPAGVTFTDDGAGTPTAGGSFLFTITAANGATPNAVQRFTLTVNPPTIRLRKGGR